MGTGKITGFPGKPSNVIDVIPVDVVTSVMLAAVAPSERTSVLPKVYHIGSGCLHPITLKEIEKIWREYLLQHPMSDNGKPITVNKVQFYDSAEAFTAVLKSRYLTPLSYLLWTIEHVPFWSNVPFLRTGWGSVNKLMSTVSKSMRLASLYCSYTLNEWIFDTRETEANTTTPNLDHNLRLTSPTQPYGNWKCRL